LGATDATWKAHHVEASGYNPGSTYGSIVPSPGDPKQRQWFGVSHSGGRVDSFHYAMPEGTSEATAKQDVLAQLPADTTTTSFNVTHDSNGNTCVLWNLRSATIARLLGPNPWGDTTGDIGGSLSSPGTDITSIFYNPSNVDTATLDLAASTPGTSC
jgi:hypothetical protein